MHTAFRTRSPEALERRVAALKDTPYHVGWNDGDLGHGPAYQCRDPDGHLIELYYETEWYQPPAELKPALKNQAQKYPARGMSVRRLDHLNFFAVDIPGARKFFMDKLGMRLTEQIVFESGEQAIWLNCTNKSYELAISLDHTGVPGRFHHVTYRGRQPRGRAARRRHLPRERRVHRDRPAQARDPADVLPLHYEPGGNRVEVANAGARLILAPDWKTIVWNEAERKKGQAWGLKTIESFHTHGTPPAPHKEAAE